MGIRLGGHLGPVSASVGGGSLVKGVGSVLVFLVLIAVALAAWPYVLGAVAVYYLGYGIWAKHFASRR